MSVSLRTPTQARAELLGLSIGQFCNTSNLRAKVTPSQIVARQQQPPREEKPQNLEAARGKIAAAGYNGKMSKRTRSNVTGMLAEWISAKKASTGKVYATGNASARTFTFCTLTLCAAQMHSDKHLKRHALGRFIQEAERQCGAKDWFWRAEDQKNGNIHFHILFSKSIPWQWIRAAWNKIMKDLGYLALYQAKMKELHAQGFRLSSNKNDKRTTEQQVKAWRAGVAADWTNPNSTDIHALAKTKNAAAYVCKYVSKEAGTRKIEGRIWGCSDSLRELKTPEIGVLGEFLRKLNGASKRGEVELIQFDHVAIYRGNIGELLKRIAPELLKALELYYLDISGWLNNFDSAAIPST